MRKLLSTMALAAMLLQPVSPLLAAETIHFALTDKNGGRVSDADFTGRTLLLFFGYTHCPDICPTTLAEMAALQQALPADLAGKLSLGFVTGDPQRDTPAVMKQYIGYFNDRILGFSGTTKEIDDLAWALKAVVIRHGDGTGDYTVDHSTNYILIRDGVILDQIPNTLDTAELLARIKTHF